MHPPRDMDGYGQFPPHPKWPNKARVAVQFVVNYEEGGENCVLEGDAASEAFLSEIVGAQPLPGVRHLNMESIYEFGSRAGVWRILRLFNERTPPSPHLRWEWRRKILAALAIKKAGHELASHGYR